VIARVRFAPSPPNSGPLLAVLLAAVSLGSACSASTPAGVDIKPITSLRLNAGPDFLANVLHQIGSTLPLGEPDCVVIHPPGDDPNHLIVHAVDVYREKDAATASQIYSKHRNRFTNAEADWKLYVDEGQGSERHFISYKGVRFDTNHAIPVAVNTKPEVVIEIQKENVLVVVSYTAYSGGSDYVQTINRDVVYAAAILAKAGS